MGMGDVAMDRMTTSIAILIGALIIGGAIIGAQLMDHYQIAMSACGRFRRPTTYFAVECSNRRNPKVCVLRWTNIAVFLRQGCRPMTDLEGLLHQIAREARVAANCALPGWAYAVILLSSNLLGETKQIKSTCSYATRATMPFELVRINLDFLDEVADLATAKLLLRMDIEPFIIGVGKVRTIETEEGLVILASDESEGIGFVEHEPTPTSGDFGFSQ
jgi:hypothetical protein